MEHLFNSRVQVYRLRLSTVDGRARSQWEPQAAPLDYVKCRLDLNFLRPGKDQPAPVEAGKAPDRIGVMFCRADLDLRAGDRVVAVPNDIGQTPVVGTFEIRVIPDQAQDFFGSHHVEVQIIEVAHQVADGQYVRQPEHGW